jgi:hypothetical protein
MSRRVDRILKNLLLAFAAVFGAAFLLALFRLPGVFSPRMMVLFLAITPLLCALTWLAALRASPALRAGTACALLVCVTSIYVAEWVLPHAGVRAAESPDGERFDTRQMLRVVADVRAQGAGAVPLLEPKAWLRTQTGGEVRSLLSESGVDLLPLGGVAHRPTVLCNETGEWITYFSDRHGMNNPDACWDEVEFELAVLGDACANGWCCDSKDHFVDLLRTLRPATVNLGMSGNGPLLILAGLLEYLPAIRPEVVLWFHYEKNDFYDLEWERKSPMLMKYLESDFTQGLVQRQAAIDGAINGFLDPRLEEWSVTPQALHSLQSFATLYRVRHVLGLRYHPPPDHALMKKVLDRAAGAVDSWQGTLFVVYLPTSARYRGGGLLPGSYDRVRRRVAATCREIGVEMIDVHRSFAAHGRPTSLFARIPAGERIGQFGHYTEEGNKLVARAVIEAIESAGTNPQPIADPES